MWCLSCPGEGEHTEYCPGRFLEEFGTPVDHDRLSLPWCPSPTSWLFGNGFDLPELGPDLDLGLLEGDELPEGLMDFVEPSVPERRCAAAAGSASTNCVDQDDSCMDSQQVVIPEAFGDDCLMEDVGPDSGFPVAIPGWNVAGYEEVHDGDTASAWPTATELADSLIQSVEMPQEDGSNLGCTTSDDS